MQIEVILLANFFFLAIVLVILTAILFTNGHESKKSNAKDDLKKIKDQINSE